MAINADIRDQAYQFFVEEAPDLLQILENGLLNLSQDRSTAKIHDLMRAAHSLKGGSASIGLDSIATLAHRMETIFRAFYNETVEIDAELENQMLQAFDCLRLPLIEQINQGFFDADAALAIADPIFNAIEARCGHALNEAESYIPSSADLGVNMVQSILEVDIAQGLERLNEVLNEPDQYEVTGELRAQIEVFAGFAEMLSLPDFTAIADAVQQALDHHPGRATEITQLAIADFEQARQAILHGNLTTATGPSEALISLAELGASGSDMPRADNLPTDHLQTDTFQTGDVQELFNDEDFSDDDQQTIDISWTTLTDEDGDLESDILQEIEAEWVLDEQQQLQPQNTHCESEIAESEILENTVLESDGEDDWDNDIVSLESLGLDDFDSDSLAMDILNDHADVNVDLNAEGGGDGAIDGLQNIEPNSNEILEFLDDIANLASEDVENPNLIDHLNSLQEDDLTDLSDRDIAMFEEPNDELNNEVVVIDGKHLQPDKLADLSEFDIEDSLELGDKFGMEIIDGLSDELGINEDGTLQQNNLQGDLVDLNDLVINDELNLEDEFDIQDELDIQVVEELDGEIEETDESVFNDLPHLTSSDEQFSESIHTDLPESDDSERLQPPVNPLDLDDLHAEEPSPFLLLLDIPSEGESAVTTFDAESEAGGERDQAALETDADPDNDVVSLDASLSQHDDSEIDDLDQLFSSEFFQDEDDSIYEQDGLLDQDELMNVQDEPIQQAHVQGFEDSDEFVLEQELLETSLDATPLTETLDATPLTETSLDATPLTEALDATPLTEASLDATPLTEALDATPLTETSLDATPLTEALDATPLTETSLDATPLTETSLDATPLTETPLVESSRTEEQSIAGQLANISAEPDSLETLDSTLHEIEASFDSLPMVEEAGPSALQLQRYISISKQSTPIAQPSSPSSTTALSRIPPSVQSSSMVPAQARWRQDSQERSSPKPKPKEAPQAWRSPRQSASSMPTNLTIRVDSDRLERMNNLVGEFSINRDSLSLLNEQLQGVLRELLNRFSRFQDMAGRLRDLSDQMLVSSESNGHIRKRPQLDTPSVSDATPDLSKILPPRYDIGSNVNTADFDSLEMDQYNAVHTQLQEILEDMVQLEEAVDDITLYSQQSDQVLEKQRHMLTHLRDELIWARMLPLSEIVNRFPRVLRDLSTNYHKPVELTLSGTSVLVDKGILEKLYDPLLHLLRNAFDHGIESTVVRRYHRKPEKGHIEIRAYHKGNQTVIEVRDDGQGLNLDDIHRRVLELGWVTESDIAGMAPADLVGFIFEPGFSTAREVSELSGRGVGLDVVQSQLKAIKGTITVTSSPGQGTTFTLSLPLTLTIVKLVICLVGSIPLALPADNIEEVLNPHSSQLKQAGEQRFLHWQDQMLPVYKLENLLEYACPLPDTPSTKALSTTAYPKNWAAPLLILRQDDRFFALEVSRLVNEQELVIKPFGSAIAPPNYIYGCTILGDGNLIPVIDGSALLDRALEERQGLLPATSKAEPRSPIPVESPTKQVIDGVSDRALTSVKRIIQSPTILVVDDAIALRRTLALSLEKEGFRVVQARDGQEAIDRLQQSTTPIELVVCDIEMPNMNGFEFLSYRRQDANLSNIPVVMLTSRSNEKHRWLAMQLGATEYFTKPYLEQKFLSRLKEILD